MSLLSYNLFYEFKNALTLNFNSSAKCHFNKIYNLKESLVFVDRHFNKNKDFQKAVKEMAFSIRSAVNEKLIPPATFLKDYTKLIEWLLIRIGIVKICFNFLKSSKFSEKWFDRKEKNRI